jgi:hypothetical protein
MIYRVYGRRNDDFNKLLCETTYDKIDELMPEDSEMELLDMDSSELYNELKGNLIFYVPTVIVTDNDGCELGRIENKYFYDIKENHRVNANGEAVLSPMSNIWWKSLDRFLLSIREDV